MEKSITRNGMKVSVYGVWKWNSNCSVIGDYANGEEMDQIWAGDDTETPNWTSAVEKITKWAKKHGHEIMELSAC